MTRESDKTLKRPHSSTLSHHPGIDTSTSLLESIQDTVDALNSLAHENTLLNQELESISRTLAVINQIQDPKSSSMNARPFVEFECLPKLLAPMVAILALSLKHAFSTVPLVLQLTVLSESHSFVIPPLGGDVNSVEWTRDIPLPAIIQQLHHFPLNLDVRIYVTASVEFPVLIEQKELTLDILDVITSIPPSLSMSIPPNDSVSDPTRKRIEHSSHCFIVRVPNADVESSRLLPKLILHPDPVIHRSFFSGNKSSLSNSPSSIEGNRASFLLLDGTHVTVSHIPVSKERLSTSDTKDMNAETTDNAEYISGYFWIECSHENPGILLMIEAALLSRVRQLFSERDQQASSTEQKTCPVRFFPPISTTNERRAAPKNRDRLEHWANVFLRTKSSLTAPIQHDNESSPMFEDTSFLPEVWDDRDWETISTFFDNVLENISDFCA